jgi:UDP-N-acetyl-D-mannosaminuronic acid dehydrogenase
MTSTVASRGLYGTDLDAAEIGDRFAGGDVPVAVYGLGKMGLPIASVFADVTGNVTGADVDPEVVESVNAGRSHVDGEPGLDDLVGRTVDSGAFEAVTDPRSAAADATVHVVIVPTLLTDANNPDLSVVRSVVDDVAAGLAPGDLVIVESTVPPGTCRDVVEPRLAEQSGLESGSFGVAFCPERTSSGRALEDIREAYPKIVGGVDEESTRVAEAIYGEVTDNDVIPVSDATTAEAVKVFGGVYRDVNIGLANEFATYADALGIDVREAIEASNTNPHSNILRPGPGVGGHCIPVYPYFLLNRFDVRSPIVEAARAVNDGMPAHVVGKLEGALEARGKNLRDSTVLVLGVTYRAGVAETRNSPAVAILQQLSNRGAETVAVDPMLDDVDGVAELIDQDEAARRDLDAVVLVTAHEAFDDYAWDAHDDLVVVDTRDALGDAAAAHDRHVVGRADGE